MDQRIRDHLASTFFREYQVLRDELMDILTDDDLHFRVGGASSSLGALCREIGEIERSYAESFRTFRLDFPQIEPDPRLEGSAAALTTWFASLDGALRAALEDLKAGDVGGRTIVRGDYDVDDFAPVPTIQLDIYREALLIFYGKVSVYLRALGKALPGHWQEWIG